MVSVVAALGLASMLVTAAAQNYPSRTVTIIVPYPAGGPTDETARMVAQSLSIQLKQSFIVEDIGGGGAIIGSEKVARAGWLHTARSQFTDCRERLALRKSSV